MIDLQAWEQIRRWLYTKQVKGIPVIYWNIPNSDIFCNVYVKMKDWIPIILDRLFKKNEQVLLNNLWHEPSEQEALEITLKAGRQAQAAWNAVRDTAIELSQEHLVPFVIRLRKLDQDKIQDIEVK